MNVVYIFAGWNRVYPYNTGDLTISAMVLYNYLEANAKVPWEDLRYLFGEIMYGGHITDDWDRKLCRTYLEEYMHPDMVGVTFHWYRRHLLIYDCGHFHRYSLGFDDILLLSLFYVEPFVLSYILSR